MGIIVIIVVILILLSLLGWTGKLLDFLFGIFAEGLGNCLGCVAKLGIWGILLLLALAAIGLL